MTNVIALTREQLQEAIADYIRNTLGMVVAVRYLQSRPTDTGLKFIVEVQETTRDAA